MRRHIDSCAGVCLLAAVTLGAQEPPKIHTVEAPPVKVHYLAIPWGPLTFAAMERGDDSYYNKRTWPFARLETSVAVGFAGTRLPPGNYALVFHPNSPDGKAGMALEVLRLAVPEFLQEGNVMQRTPPGESVLKRPVVFEKAAETAPALAIGVVAEGKRLRLTIHYGDRKLVQELDP